MTLFAQHMNTIARALGTAICILSRENEKYGVGFWLSDKDVARDDATIYLYLMDGPSATGKRIKTLTASSSKTDYRAYIADIVQQFEVQIYDLQDDDTPAEEGCGAECGSKISACA